MAEDSRANPPGLSTGVGLTERPRPGALACGGAIRKRPLKVVLTHDWLNGMRGGEKCLEVFCQLYPESPVYTLFREPGKISEAIASHPVRTSRVQGFPGVFRHYRYYLPFFPSAVESLRLESCDLVISTSHCVAKGVRKPEGARHLSYCFTPMRYAWALFEEYFGGRGPLTRSILRATIERLKEWDVRTSRRVDRFVAISEHIRRRIRDCYGREADVIYPPVDTDFYTPAPVTRENFYLVVSALVPYKRVGLALAAAAKARVPVVVIGEGPERAALERSAGPGARFLGWQSDEVIRDHYRRARALLFPGEEDFGIVPVEAQACGCPVVAYAKGGALETVESGKTGVFFEAPDVEALREALRRLDTSPVDPDAARAKALGFSRERFAGEVRTYVEDFMREKTPVAR